MITITRRLLSIAFFLFCWLFAVLNSLAPHNNVVSTAAESTVSLQQQQKNRVHQVDLLAERPGTLLISTIDGYLTAIDAQTGVDKWRFKEGPLIESPVNVQRGFTFIPDPRDGQLYLIVEGRLSKLPFTIPHLVRVSPCKSSDGVFYAGSKKDVWISVNPETGERMDPFAPASPTFCPASHGQAVHIGKTEYHIQMLDTKQRDRHWNATFVDYSSHLLPEDADYHLQHFTSSADGRVLTVDARSGFVLWQRDFSNVIVNMYLLKGDGMHRLPSTAIGQETFELLAQSVALNPLLHAPAQLPDRLFPTLYVGQSRRNGLYALPAYVDERTNRIAPKYLGPPLLEGPKPEGPEGGEGKQLSGEEYYFTADADLLDGLKRQILPPETVGPTYTTKDGGEFLILGYHQMPKATTTGVFPFSEEPSPSNVPLLGFNNQQQKQQQSGSGNSIVERKTSALMANNAEEEVAVRWTLPLPSIDGNAAAADDSGFFMDMMLFSQRHPYQVCAVLAVIVSLIIVSAWLLGKQSALLTRHRTESAGSTLTTAQGSEIGIGGGGGDASRSSRGSVFTAYEPDEMPLGWHRVNSSALSYNSGQVLGRGCEGTIVYLGTFNARPVAVKRIVSANLDRGVRQQIEREVEHLLKSDSHTNVIRYFCSETDRHFHYIALELCDASLDDFIRQQREEGGELLSRANRLELLKQTADGIAHLHRINIVHRDVKPKNILLTRLDNGVLRVKISDFGLCKSVKLGHNSISKVSGVVGTDGWMAPELFSSADGSVTYAVDVFSLGCVFYYVLADGHHPFGEPMSRMSNIHTGQHSLDQLDELKDYTSRSLVEVMIRPEAGERPEAAAVAAHPLFWEPAKQLQFLMEVSDFIEKKEGKDPVMRRLEWRRQKVIGTWLDQVDELLRLDLVKQRSYHNNVRDLLRAVRNKKHHYQELSPELRTLLGPLPNDYLAYFTSRFPMLLMHAFMALACAGQETVFHGYYSPDRLRDFYERERDRLYRLEKPPYQQRHSASPENWRREQQQRQQQQQQLQSFQPTWQKAAVATATAAETVLVPSAPTVLMPAVAAAVFDPSIPPPPPPHHHPFMQKQPLDQQQQQVQQQQIQFVPEAEIGMGRMTTMTMITTTTAILPEEKAEEGRMRRGGGGETNDENDLQQERGEEEPQSKEFTTIPAKIVAAKVKSSSSAKAKKAKRKNKKKAPFSLLVPEEAEEAKGGGRGDDDEERGVVGDDDEDEAEEEEEEKKEVAKMMEEPEKEEMMMMNAEEDGKEDVNGSEEEKHRPDDEPEDVRGGPEKVMEERRK